MKCSPIAHISPIASFPLPNLPEKASPKKLASLTALTDNISNWKWSDFTSYIPTTQPEVSLPATPQLIKHSKLIENIKDKSPTEITTLLQKIYGERLISDAITKLKLADKAAFTPSDIKFIQATVATEVNLADLQSFYDRLKLMHDEEIATLLQYFPESIVRHLIELITTMPTPSFEELSDTHIDLLLKFFRNETKEDDTSIPLTLSTEELTQLHQLCYPAYKRLRALSACQDFINHHTERNYDNLAASEYMSRHVAYSRQAEGLLIPYPNASGSPHYYEVKHTIHKNGFGFCLLQGITPAHRTEFKALFQGTDTNDPESVMHNFAEVAGLNVFNLNKAAVISAIYDACESLKAADSKNVIHLAIYGHSQGGALSQHLIEAIVSDMVATLESSVNSPLHSLKTVKVSTWCSPRVLEKQAKQFAAHTAQLMHHEKTHHCTFSFEDNVVAGDPVPFCGETHVASEAHSDNVSRKVNIFYPTGSSIKAPHCSPILAMNANPEPAKVVHDDRTTLLILYKQAACLDFMIASRMLKAKINELTADNINGALSESIQLLEEISIASIPSTHSKETTVNGKISDKEVITLIGLLNSYKTSKQHFSFIKNFMETETAWIQTLNAMTVDDLMQERTEKVNAYITQKTACQATQQAIQTEMSKSAYKSLTGNAYKSLADYDKKTMDTIIDYSKQQLSTLVNPAATVNEKVLSGAQLVGGAAALAVGTLTALSALPVNLTLGAAALGIAMRVNRLIRK